MSESTMKLVGWIVLAVVVLSGVWMWYSHEEQVTGIVSSKWVETSTSTSCDSKGNNCHTSTKYTYLIQLRDGRIYHVFWGSRDYDRMLEGDEITFIAYGYHVQLFGWRIQQPSIFGFEIISRKEVPGKPGSSLFF